MEGKTALTMCGYFCPLPRKVPKHLGSGHRPCRPSPDACNEDRSTGTISRGSSSRCSKTTNCFGTLINARTRSTNGSVHVRARTFRFHLSIIGAEYTSIAGLITPSLASICLQRENQAGRCHDGRHVY